MNQIVFRSSKLIVPRLVGWVHWIEIQIKIVGQKIVDEIATLKLPVPGQYVIYMFIFVRKKSPHSRIILTNTIT